MACMAAEIRRSGLSEVYKPAGNLSHTIDIVFVHGLFGHPRNTWTYIVSGGEQPQHSDYSTSNADHTEPARKKIRSSQKEPLREVFWPQDLLPQIVPQARVLVWGYEVQIDQILNSTSKSSIFKFAETLLSDLTTLRNSASDKARPLIFISHSLGGIVVKDALCLSRDENTFLNEILPATHAVLFLGTPHYGSKIASLGKLAFEVSKMFFQNPNTKVLRGLEINSEILERISRSFGQILASGNIRLHSFREELDTKGFRIVDEYSSSIGYPSESTGTILANHRNIAKFPSTEDVGFRKVASIVRRWVDDLDRSSQGVELLERTEMTPRALPHGLTLEETADLCVNSLNRPEARHRMRDIEAVYENTYDWLFEDRVGYTKWLSGSIRDPTFWIQGKPGSGKSTVMKHAMEHDQTSKCLSLYNENQWILAGFFFHDRGSTVQKSIPGLLRESLYQILSQRKDLFPSIYPLVSNLISRSNKVSAAALADTWNSTAIENALSLIASSSNSSVNLCLFIDALDEHDGTYKDLIRALRRLLQLDLNPRFRLRLCLAGRPDNPLKDAFQSCPGILLQEHTINDIRSYARGRIKLEMCTKLTNEGEAELEVLCDEIITKSSGVFLWVRLVVDELIESLCEGNTVAEMRKSLSNIPPELEGLYARALRRKGRGPHLTSSQREEAYIMYQIAMCCRQPFRLDNFLYATLLLMRDKTSQVETELLSIDQMKRRLNSRAAGLLESVPDFGYNVVQFIHQSVKTFMTFGEGKIIIQESLRLDHPRESGYVLILHYIVSILGKAAPGHAWVFGPPVTDDFVYYAQIIEHNEEIPASSIFEPAMSGSSDDAYRRVLTDLVHANFYRGFRGYLNLESYPPLASLGFFYIHSHLALSLKHFVLTAAPISSTPAYDLLHAAFKSQIPAWISVENRRSCVDVLLEMNVGARLSNEGFHTLDGIIERYSGSTAIDEHLLPTWPRIRDQARHALGLHPPFAIVEDDESGQNI